MREKNQNIKYPKVYFKDIVGYLWRGVRGDRLLMLVIFLGVSAGAALDVIAPLFYKRFFDLVSLAGDRAMVVPQLVRLIFVVMAFHTGAWVCWRLSSFAASYFQANSMANLRRQAYNYLLRHSYGFFTNNFTGALVQRIGRYARAFERLTDRLAWNFIPLMVRLVVIAIITATIDIRITILITGWALIYMAVNYFYSVWRLEFNLEAARADSRTTAVLADSISNQNNIEIFNRYMSETENFRAVTDDQKKINIANWNVGNWLDAIQSALIIAIEFVVFYFAIQYWEREQITLGTFVIIQLYIIGLSSQLWDFSRIIRDFYESYADAEEIVAIMKLPYEINNISMAKPLKVGAGQVDFKNVNFAFNETRRVLKAVSLIIKPGEKVALVGPSGSGKTTFVRLLLRFYDVTSGRILIDGQDIHGATLESLRENISLVPQDPLLFHRTIRENIRYGRPSATDQEVEEAARLAHCDEFIKNLSLKYETYVGERGIKLSGGERQRVAIARAILKNAPILILDEATSSLDSHSEALIQDALDTLMKGKTVIVIAHRLSTIRKMDRIIVLENGEIREEGTHDSLVAADTLYGKLWSLQAGGFMPAEEEEEE